ncbi:MAG: DUF4234 domain-containing protein [Clostridia bacterium]|nr:DUF4234 domain-containing protein [Clostridia bacterium]
MQIRNRSIPACVILSIVTLGIYGIYLFVVMTNETNALAPKNATTSGGKAVLLTLITFGIYSIYWNYKLGCKIDDMNGNSGGNTGLLYLIIGLVGFSIVNYCLAQSEINKFANA